MEEWYGISGFRGGARGRPVSWRGGPVDEELAFSRSGACLLQTRPYGSVCHARPHGLDGREANRPGEEGTGNGVSHTAGRIMETPLVLAHQGVALGV
jgi:hypothetical protein